MDTRIVPVGHRLGAWHAPPERFEQIRLGAAVHDLAPAQFGRWLLAHGVPGSAGPSAWTGAALRETAGDLDDLLTLGLLAEITPDAEEAFATTHRLVPLALGLGVVQPGCYAVGLLHEPLVHLSGPLYDLWEWAHLSGHLWAACTELAELGDAGPEVVLAGLLECLPQLLSAGVACLDRA